MTEMDDIPPIPEALADVKRKWSNAFDLFRKFFRTRKAIISGAALYSLETEQTQQRGLLGPWKFNACKTAFVGGTGTLLQHFIDAIGGVKAPDIDVASLNPAFDRILQGTSDWTAPFAIPFIITCGVYLAAWGSLKGEDQTQPNKRRARSAYLYFDAAYMLVPQFLIVVPITVYTTESSGPILNRFPSITLVLLALFMVGSFWSTYLISRTIPKLLFRLNGYSTRRRHFWQPSKPDDPPWSKFSYAILIGGWPVIAIAILLLMLTDLFITVPLYLLHAVLT